MDLLADSNDAIWKSTQLVQERELRADERTRKNAAQWRLLGELLPFDTQDAFTFADLGAGTGSATSEILRQYPRSTAILTDFSAPMMAVGELAMEPFAGRFHYLKFDMSTNDWPAALPRTLDAIVTSMCVHHLPDHRKEGLFTEIFGHLVPGGWYLNYDSVRSADPLVTAAWQRVIDLDPEALRKRLHGTADEQARRSNHRRYLLPLPQQLDYLRAAGFEGIDVYWKNLDDVIYGGCRPA
ncbi:MAG: class I SAM-dependent methyltransferase [Cellulomonas sp.]